MIAKARKITGVESDLPWYEKTVNQIAEALDKAIAAERERCAKVAEALLDGHGVYGAEEFAYRKAALAIRKDPGE